MNSGLTSHQQRGHTETGPRFKVSSERPEKRGIDLATPGLVVQRVIHYTTAAPETICTIDLTSQICCLGYEDAHLHVFIHPNQPNYDPNHLKRGHLTKRKVGASVSCGHIFLVFYLFTFFFRCGHGIPWWR